MKTAIIAILMFCLLIFIHELGHFLAAKACDVKVNKFALGMGPAIFRKKKGETEYSLRIFPIGGFCEMEGENGDIESSADDPSKEKAETDIDIDTGNSEIIPVSENPRAFSNKKAWQKILILFAGPAMNALLALVLMALILFGMGTATTTINKVMDGSPAAAAGLQSGDRIVSIDGKKIEEWTDVSNAVNTEDRELSDKIEVVAERDGKEVSVTTSVMEEDGNKLIGIEPQRRHSVWGAVSAAPGYTWDLTKQMYGAVKQLVTGQVSTRELSGPVGIVYLVNKSTQAGIISVLYLVALISLNLGIFNMLPFPALDGGRIVFVLIRKITGKLISDKVEAMVNAGGMLLLLLLMVYVTWNDVLRFIAPLF
jgi:regulator of sigma E protease